MESIKVIVNNHVYKDEVENPNELLASIFSTIPGLEYWSRDALKELYIGALELCKEYIEQFKEEHSNPFQKKVPAFKKRMLLALRYFPLGRKDALTKIWDTILVRDKLGLLRNYGYSNNFGDRVSGDPERQSMYDIIPKDGGIDKC